MTFMQDRIRELNELKCEYQIKKEKVKKEINNLSVIDPNYDIYKTILLERMFEISEDISYIDKEIIDVKKYKY